MAEAATAAQAKAAKLMKAQLEKQAAIRVKADKAAAEAKVKAAKKVQTDREREQFIMRHFGKYGAKVAQRSPDLDRSLHQAAYDESPDLFASRAVAYGAASAAFGLVVGLVAGIILLGIGKGILAGIAGLVGGAFLGYMVPFMGMQGVVKRRAGDMNRKLAFAINFMASLASAGVAVPIIFASLGEQPLYGEIAVESKKLRRAVDFLGRDLVTAIREAARRSPSHMWSEFLYGCINTINSGGDLVTYFTHRATQYTEEQHRKQRAFFSTLGIVAEVYVILVGATPLFLVITLSITVVLGGGVNPSTMNYMLAFLVIPGLQALFAYALLKMTPN
jgi:Flp pilus assembly protein TadB